MSKVAAIFDKPERCFDCPCRHAPYHVCGLCRDGNQYLKHLTDDDLKVRTPDWCPLVECRIGGDDPYENALKKLKEAGSAWMAA